MARKTPEEANISAWLVAKDKADARLARRMEAVARLRSRADSDEAAARAEHAQGIRSAEQQGRMAQWRAEQKA